MEETTDDEKFSPRNEKTGIRINLKRIKSAYSEKAHNESNLPNVLDEYGLESKENKPQEHDKQKKKTKKVGVTYADHDTESQEKRRKKREELSFDTFSSPNMKNNVGLQPIRNVPRYAQMMEEQARNPEGSQYYSRKVSTLMTRMATPDEHISLRRDVQPDSKQEKHVLKKRLERHTLSNDNSFMKDLPKSELAKVVELQDKLVREGKLKTQSEIDNFREDIKKPEVYDHYFKKKTPSETGSNITLHTENKTPRPLIKDAPPRSLSHISETSRPVTREDWAVTHAFPSKNDEGKNISSRRQATMDLEKRFAKPVMPPLKCFTMDLGEKPPDPEELERQAELRVRVKQRKKFLRKLQRMHQMAMAHGAAASRIMEKHGEIANILEGTTLKDVISVLPRPEDEYLTEEDLIVPQPGEYLGPQDRLTSRQSTRSTISSHGSRRTLLSRGRPSDTRGSQRPHRKTLRSREAKIVPSKPDPLTMDEIREKTKVIEAKCLSTNWINYMKSGKQSSIFPIQAS